MTRAVAQLASALMPLMLAVGLCAQTQDTTSQGANGAPPAATGTDISAQMTENPPLSGLDQPRFEPGFGARSYFAPKAEVTQAIDSNAGGDFSRSGLTGTTRAFGSLDLQKLWKRHPFDLDYIGGLDYFSGLSSHVYQAHTLDATQRFLWRTGQLALRDSFNYLPEGAFGFGSFGGAAGFGGDQIPSGTGPGMFYNGQFGALGNQPRLNNIAMADLTQYLTPRSAVVLTGAFGLTDFINSASTSSCATDPKCFFKSQEVIGQIGYNYQISRHDQVAVLYAYEALRFPTALAGSLKVDVWQVLYGHRISGKFDFLLGGGPELVYRDQTEAELFGVLPIGAPCTQAAGFTCGTVKNSFLTGSARAEFRYHASARTEFSLGYLRYISAGSGFFGGANTDVVRLSANHSLARHWTVVMDGGYSRNSRLLAVSSGAAGGASNYHFWYVGGGLHRQFGRSLGGFVSYQYNRFGFGNEGCSTGSTRCGLTYGRNIALIGVHWTPRPIRLD